MNKAEQVKARLFAERKAFLDYHTNQFMYELNDAINDTQNSRRNNQNWKLISNIPTYKIDLPYLKIEDAEKKGALRNHFLNVVIPEAGKLVMDTGYRYDFILTECFKLYVI